MSIFDSVVLGQDSVLLSDDSNTTISFTNIKGVSIRNNIFDEHRDDLLALVEAVKQQQARIEALEAYIQCHPDHVDFEAITNDMKEVAEQERVFENPPSTGSTISLAAPSQRGMK